MIQLSIFDFLFVKMYLLFRIDIGKWIVSQGNYMKEYLI